MEWSGVHVFAPILNRDDNGIGLVGFLTKPKYPTHRGWKRVGFYSLGILSYNRLGPIPISDIP